MCQPADNESEKIPVSWGKGGRKKRASCVREKQKM